jgi:hypothetical protein
MIDTATAIDRPMTAKKIGITATPTIVSAAADRRPREDHPPRQRGRDRDADPAPRAYHQRS